MLVETTLKVLDFVKADENCAGAQDLIKQNIAFLGENIVKKITNGESANKNGYDILVHDGKYKGRIEVKTSFQPTDNALGAFSLASKKSNCDYIALVNANNLNNIRVSIIPEKIFFKEAKLSKSANKENDTFRYSVSYNQKDKVQTDNTNLVLKYEVPFANDNI